jgi:hypothetical protein
MPQLLGQVILLALAAALSTVPITATIFILLSDRRNATAFPFLAGWVIGTVATLTLTTLLAQALPGGQRQVTSLIGQLEILVGIALVVLGLVTLVRLRRRSPSDKGPGWIESIGSFGVVPAFGIGLALNARPKAVLLITAAGLAIRAASIGPTQTLVVIAVYTAIATSTVVIPIVATALFPRYMEPRLLAARDWITAHGALLTAAIMILVGAFVIGAGITR